MHVSLANSLKMLQTDYVDILYLYVERSCMFFCLTYQLLGTGGITRPALRRLCKA